MSDDIRDEDYQALASFRYELRRFLQFSEQAATAAGLSPQQHQAMLAIRAAPDRQMLVGELAERLLLKPHSASGLVDRLERLDMVSRVPAPADKRQIVVTLTPTGDRLLRTLTAAHRDELRRLRPLLARLLSGL
jgi:DNA-binding MarR family transcriptional regulator